MRGSKPAGDLHLLLDRMTGALEEVGFSRGGRRFAREVEDGIKQFVDVFVAPGGSTQSRQFTITLDVFLPAVSEVHLGRRVDVPSVEHSQVRANLGQLSPPYEELWWATGDAAEVSDEISRRLKRYALPLLDNVSSYASVVRNWRVLDWQRFLTRDEAERRRDLVKRGEYRLAGEFMRGVFQSMRRRPRFQGVIAWNPTAAVSAAILLARLGRRPQAARLLGDERARASHRGHARFIERVATDLGLALD
jgi:hypothetical protein